MRIEIKRTIDSSQLHFLCVRNEWYSKGTNEDYGELFSKVFNLENVSDMDIYNIAKDILDHNNKDDYIKESGLNEKQLIQSIMYEVNTICNTFFEIIESI